MGLKAVLLYKDIPLKDWPEDASGEFIYKIVDAPPSGRVPDSRPWRVWTADQAAQYSSELDNDFERFDESFGRLTIDKRIKLALRRAEEFGNQLFEEFKLENVLGGLDKSQVRKLDKDLAEVSSLLRGGSLNAFLNAMAEIIPEDPALPPEEQAPGYTEGITEQRVLKYGNAVRQYLGLDIVDEIVNLDEGVV